MTTCRHCRTEWTGLRIAHCASCHETFTTPGNFDKHRRDGGCLLPGQIGLVLNRRQQWAMPGRDAA